MKTEQATLTKKIARKNEHEIIMYFLAENIDEVLGHRREIMLDALLLALTNDERPISHDGRMSKYEGLISFMDVLKEFLNQIKTNKKDLANHAKEILDSAFLLDKSDPTSTSYMQECRSVLNELILAVLKQDKVGPGKYEGYQDLIFFFDAVNNLINDVEKFYSTKI